MAQIQNIEEWHEIGDKLTGYFNICSCQRKIKTIVDNLLSIKQKCNDAFENGTERNFTGAEWLLIAIIDKNSDAISHGINCEYPIIINDDPLWLWLEEIKDNPNLVDD